MILLLSEANEYASRACNVFLHRQRGNQAAVESQGGWRSVDELGVDVVVTLVVHLIVCLWLVSFICGA